MIGIYDVSEPVPPPQLPIPFCVMGLDLGKLSDFTALALLEWELPPKNKRVRTWRADYRNTTLKRWRLGTPYLDIIDQVMKFTAALPERCKNPLLVVDATGVGEAVVEAAVRQFREAKMRGSYVAVTITGGNAVTNNGNARWSVAKKQLASHMQVVMGSRRLHVAAQLPERPTLLRELETFTVKITAAGNESFESWRERDHDDLVLAVALAVWAAERGIAYRNIG